MKKKLNFLLDYDDVLVKCNDTAIKRLNSEYGTEYTIYDIKKWGPMGNRLDERLKYYSDPDFIASLPLMEGAREFVQELSEIGDVFIMTSVESICASARITHILENFPEIPASNILIGGRKDMINADMALDDGIHNLENSNAAYPVLFQRPWNYGKNGILSVSGYKEFLQLAHIIGNFSKKEGLPELVSIIGPVGSGKKEIANNLIDSGIFKRVATYTTKKDATSYHIISRDDFTYRKESGFFFETSIYMGEFFGTRYDDIIAVIDEGKIPVMILDINGAMAIQSKFNTLNVFAKTSKEDCIREILSRNFPIDEAVQKITSLDLELHNEELCDLSISKDEIGKIISLYEKETK